MKTFEEKRKEVLNGDLKLRREADKDGKLSALFADKSFAIVGDDKLMVPILPRHMTKDNWRELYWLKPSKLVINGKKHKTLCSICRLSLSCLSKGQGRSGDFKCTASRDTIIVPLTTRKRGEP